MIEMPPEVKQETGVSIEYEGLAPEESIFKIDEKRLDEALVKFGYPEELRVPVVITAEKNGNAWAANDLAEGRVLIYQDEIIQSYRDMYRRVLEAMGEATKKDEGEDGFVQRIIDSPLVKTLLPTFLPYLLVQEPVPKMYTGSQDRLRNYIEKAKAGTLQEGKTLEEQRTRAKKHIARLMMKSLQRIGSWTVGHEYEHGKDIKRKKIIKAALFLGPMVLAGALVTAAASYASAHGLSADAVEGAMMTGYGGAGGFAAYGFFKGRAVEESASYKAGTEHLEEIMECLDVNPEIFLKEVIEKVDAGSEVE